MDRETFLKYNKSSVFDQHSGIENHENSNFENYTGLGHKFTELKPGASTPYIRWSKCTMKNRGEVFAGT